MLSAVCLAHAALPDVIPYPHMTPEEEAAGFTKWLAASYLPPEVKSALADGREPVGKATEIVAGITSIVGMVGAVINLIELLGFSDSGRDPLQYIANEIRNIENLLISTYQHTIDAEWNAALAQLTTAAQALDDYLSDSNAATADRRGLIDDTGRNAMQARVIDATRNVVNQILPPEGGGPPTFQEVLNNPELQYAVDWVPQYYERLDAAALGVTGLPSVPLIDDLTLPKNATLWDYRRSLPYVIHAVTQLISSYRVFDPAFRTTRRFHEDLVTVVRSLDVLAANWFACLCWWRGRTRSTRSTRFPTYQTSCGPTRSIRARAPPSTTSRSTQR